MWNCKMIFKPSNLENKKTVLTEASDLNWPMPYPFSLCTLVFYEWGPKRVF